MNLIKSIKSLVDLVLDIDQEDQKPRFTPEPSVIGGLIIERVANQFNTVVYRGSNTYHIWSGSYMKSIITVSDDLMIEVEDLDSGLRLARFSDSISLSQAIKIKQTLEHRRK